MGGVGDTLVPTIIFQTWVYLDGKDYPCRLQADFTGHERIVGRDVLNALDILFRGIARSHHQSMMIQRIDKLSDAASSYKS